MTTSVVVMPGSVDRQWVPAIVESADLVIAADGGFHLAEAMGLHPHVIVGDLDSVSSDAVDRAIDGGIEIERHLVDKDLTDFDLAARRALSVQPDRLVVLGGGGGRLDHLLGNLAVLSGVACLASRGSSCRAVEIEAWFGSTLIVPIAGLWQRALDVGSVLSLIAWGGPARLTASGVRWPLFDEVLQPHSTRGISNEVTESVTRVEVADGLVVIIAPDAAGSAASGESERGQS